VWRRYDHAASLLAHTLERRSADQRLRLEPRPRSAPPVWSNAAVRQQHRKHHLAEWCVLGVCDELQPSAMSTP